MKSIRNHCFQPIASWTGKLLPPSKDLRHPKGGTLLHITHAPNPEHIGKIVWLVWRDREANGWQEQIKIDIRFSSEIMRAKAKGNLYPDKIDGLSNVSALEVLASLSEHDPIDVMIEEPQLISDEKDIVELVTDREPVQILGKEYGLVTFLHPLNEQENRWKVRHYNLASGRFDGLECVMSIADPIQLDESPMMITSIKNIHLSPLNKEGWYVYGEHAQNIFFIKGLEPRSLTSVQPAKRISGLSQIKDYYFEGNWDEANNIQGSASATDLSPSRQIKWNEGESYLVLHLLAPFQGDKEWMMLNYLRRYTIHLFAELTCFLRAGHFSFGIAKIVKDPLTQELRFDITYHQVLFAHMIPRFSGSQKWHRFMGSVQIGSMFLRPTSDVIIHLPEFDQTYEKSLNPLAIFRSHLEKITALSRRGQKGEGGLHFDMINTCTRESGQALFEFVHDLKQRTHHIKESKTFTRLHYLLNKMVQRLLESEAGVPYRWKKDESGKLTCPVSESGLKKWIYAFQTRKLSFPKELQDKLVSVCMEEGVPFRILKSNMIGGYIDGVKPRKPNANVVDVLSSISKDLFNQMRSFFVKNKNEK